MDNALGMSKFKPQSHLSSDLAGDGYRQHAVGPNEFPDVIPRHQFCDEVGHGIVRPGIECIEQIGVPRFRECLDLALKLLL